MIQLEHSILAVMLAASVNAQTIPEGYAVQTSAVAGATSLVARHDAGLATFDGSILQIEQPGQPAVPLLQFAAPRFGAFLRPVRFDGPLLFGESSQGEIWLVPVDGTQPRLLTTLNLPYDAAIVSATHAVVSAKTGGFAAPLNDLIVVDLNTGATSTLSMVPGASGPVCTNPTGGLFFANAPANFPPPPGSVDVRLFSETQISLAIQQGATIQASAARLVFSGLDAVGYMAADSDRDLLFTDWMNNTVQEIDEILSAQPVLHTLVDYAGTPLFPSGLQYVPARPTDRVAFEPFAQLGAQPGTQSGAELVLLETDFVNTTVRTIESRPARLIVPTAPVPAGPVQLGIADGPSSGFAILGLTAQLGGLATLGIPGIEQQVQVDLAFLSSAPLAIVLLDAGGAANHVLTNPGGLAGFTFYAQAAVISAASDTMGATLVNQLVLGP